MTACPHAEECALFLALRAESAAGLAICGPGHD